MLPSKTLDAGIQQDLWLTSIFGYDVYKVASLPENGLPRVPRGFFYAKVPARDVAALYQWTRAGFQVIDLTLTFERRPGALVTPTPDAVPVRKARLEDTTPVLDIAGTAFEFSRFHLDPRIPRLTADKIKREWVANTLAGRRGSGAYVVEMNRQPAGFLTTLSLDDKGQKALVIDLVGVAKTYQRRGVGQSLVDFVVMDAGRGYDLLRVGTQAANVPSCRLYEKRGFQLAESTYVLHAHTQNGEIVS